LERILTKTFRLGTNDCDLAGGWRAGAILNAMQEAAGQHGTELGFGRDVLDPQGLVWVVSRVEVIMDRCPRYGEDITLTTFPTAIRRWFFPRFFVMTDAAGNRIGCASTLWLLMDVNTRRMASPDVIRHLIPDNSDLEQPMGLPSAAPSVHVPEVTAEYHPCYTDLDLNRHVNNTRYMDLCCNALGVDLMAKRYIRRFCVTYDKEIRADQTITTCLKLDGDTFAFAGYEGETRHFDLGGELADR